MRFDLPGCGDVSGWSRGENADRPLHPAPEPEMPERSFGAIGVVLLGVAITVGGFAFWLLR